MLLRVTYIYNYYFFIFPSIFLNPSVMFLVKALVYKALQFLALFLRTFLYFFGYYLFFFIFITLITCIYNNN